MEALVIRDTHKLVANLQKRGFSAQQAEGITDAIKEIDASQLLTKADLKDALRDLQVSLYKFLAGVLIAHGLATAALTVTLTDLLK
jgi:hypothetical protein